LPRKRNPDDLVATDPPHNQIAVADIEAVAESRAEGAGTAFLFGLIRPKSHQRRGSQGRYQTKEDQSARQASGLSKTGKINRSDIHHHDESPSHPKWPGLAHKSTSRFWHLAGCGFFSWGSSDSPATEVRSLFASSQSPKSLFDHVVVVLPPPARVDEYRRWLNKNALVETAAKVRSPLSDRTRKPNVYVVDLPTPLPS
jgi:hypothetical protein